MSQSQNACKPHWWKCEVVINAFILLVTAVAAGLAAWAALEASRAADEAKETRFADNLPAWKIFSRGMEEGKAEQPPITIENVGEGPGHLLGFGYSDLVDRDDLRPRALEVTHPMPLRECVPPSCTYRIMPENFDEVAKRLAPTLRCSKVSKFADLLEERPKVLRGERRYFIQFSDVFNNQYRQYFHYDAGNKSVTCYGPFVIGPKENGDYRAWPPPPPYKPEAGGKGPEGHPWW